MKHTHIFNITGRLLLSALLLAATWIGAQAETIEQTVTFNSNVWGTTAKTLDGTETWTRGGVTMSNYWDSGDFYYNEIYSDGTLRIAYPGSMTLAVPSGCTITKVNIVGSGDGLSTATGTLTSISGGYTWTGSTSSLTLNGGSYSREGYTFESFTVTLEAELNTLASVSGSVATYDFTTSNATPFVDVSLHAKTITAGSQEVYLDGFNASSDPMVQMSMTNMSTYLHMPAGSRLWVQRSSNSSNVYITQVKFTTTSGYPDLTPDGGTYDATTGVWTGSEDQLIFTVNADADIQVIQTEAVEMYTINLSMQGRGTVKVGDLVLPIDDGQGNQTLSGSIKVKAGTDVDFVITPSGERFYAEQAEDNQTDIATQAQTGSYTISGIDADHTVYVRFALKFNHVTYMADGNGNISFSATSLNANDEETSYSYPLDGEIRNLSQDIGIPYGATALVFTMTADNGNKLSSLLVDGVDKIASVVKNGNVYTYTHPSTLTTDIMVQASYVAEAPEPYAQVSDGVLTFLYDTNKGDFCYDVEVFASAAARGWDDYKGSIQQVVFTEDFKSNYAITSMAYWFSGMSALENIDLQGLNVSGLSDITEMFSGCPALKTIYADNSWPTSGLSGSNVFEACTLLVGGRGTSFATAGDTGASYARIDKAPSAPGYFTGPDDESKITLTASANGAVTAEVYSPTGGGTAETYNITADSGERTKTIFVPAGYSVRLSMTPAEYYSLGKLKIASDAGTAEIEGTDYDNIPEVSGSRFYTYENAVEGCVVTVEFETTKYEVALYTSAGGTINYTLDRSYGDDAPSGTVTPTFAPSLTVDHFTNLTLQFVPDANYSFTKLLADDSDVTGNVVDNAITLNSFNDNITYSAEFTLALHTVNLAATANGTYRAEIVDAPDGLDKTYVDVFDEDQTIDVPNGYSLKLSITSNDNYTLGLVNIDGVTVPTADITPTSDHEWEYTITDASTISNVSVTFAEKAAEPYARLEDGTMTFYYNNQKTASDYEVKTFASAEERGWNNDANTVTTVAFDESFKGGYAITSMAYWFSGMTSLTTIDFTGLNVSGLGDVSGMFAYCVNLNRVDVDNNWPGASETGGVSGSGVFTGCAALEGARGTKFSTASVVDASYARIDKQPTNPGYFWGPDTEYKMNLTVGEHGSVVAIVSKNGVEEDTYDGITSTAPQTIYVPAVSGYSVTLRMTPYPDYQFSKYYEGTTEITSGFTYDDGATVYTYAENSISNDFSASVEFAVATYNITLIAGPNGKISYTLNDDAPVEVGPEDTKQVTVTATSTLKLEVVPNAGYQLDKFLFTNGATSQEITVPENNTVEITTFDTGDTYTASFTQKATEAYARLDGTTLTFYYNNLKVDGDYEVKAFTDASQRGWNDVASTITNVVLDESFKQYAPTSTAHLFANMGLLTSLDLTNLNTANATDMQYMFISCHSLTSLDLRGFNTANVTNMDLMFYGCSGLTNLNLGNFNTAQVTSMGQMFFNCSGLTSLDLSSFNTAAATDMHGMFWGCSALKTITVGSGWTTASVTNGDAMFESCVSIVGARGTKYDENYRDATYARIDKAPHAPGYLTGTDTEYQMPLTVGDNGAVTAEVLNATGGTEDTYSITQDATERTKTVYVPEGYSVKLTMTPAANYSLSTLTVGDAEIPATDISDESGAKVYTISNVTEGKAVNVQFALTAYEVTLSAGANGSIKYTVNDETTEYTVSAGQSIPVSVDYTTVLHLTFEPASAYNFGALIKDGTENIAVTNNAIDLSGFTANATYAATFVERDVEAYARLDMASATLTFYYNNVKEDGDYAITTFDDTNRPGWSDAVASINNIAFDNSFSAYAPTSTAFWFAGMSQLTALDLKSLNVSNLTDINSMFNGCSALVTITVGNSWPAETVTGSNVFTGCTAIKGGRGTTYSADHTDATYARIDKQPSAPGYLTGTDAEHLVSVGAGANGALKVEVLNTTGTTVDTYNDIAGETAQMVYVPDGYSVKVTMTPAANYSVGSLTYGETTITEGFADGEGTSKIYTINNVTKDFSIAVLFTAAGYTITYDLAGGALPEGVSNPTSYTIETETFSLNNPTREGYTFIGWTGTGLTEATTTVTIEKGSTGERSYTANWSVVTYTITYDLAGGALAEGVTNPATYTVESDAITLNNPTREGYTFAGWTGTGLTEATVTVVIPTGSTENRAYTATWILNGGYAITYDLAGGSLPEGVSNPTSYTIETETFTLNNPIREGYTFAGWTGTGLTEATTTVTIEKGSTGERSYTANWSVVTYTITYDLAGGALAEGVTNPDTYTVETETFTLNNPTREGYTFAGWTGTGLTEATMTVTIEKGSTGNREYTATWILNGGYAITYDLAGGSLPEGVSNPTSYTIETETFTLNNPVREGYTFAGWTGTGLIEATMTVTIEKGSTGNREYTATWILNGGYAITYDLAGGSLPEGVSNPTSYTIETETFTLNNPTREGYTFVGWTGTGLTEATTTVTIEKGSTGERSYTANWSVVTYTITYDLAGGALAEGVTNPATYTVESDAITLNNPTLEGYTFAGWTGTGLTEATVTVVIPTGSTGNREYTATFEEITAVAYARLSGNTLSFYYDTQKTDTDYLITTGENPGWADAKSSINKVFIDGSFQNFAPTSVAYWFSGMEQLKDLDLRNLNTSNVTNMTSMFQGCSNLTRILVTPEWKVNGAAGSDIGVNMFSGCISLSGARGTVYSDEHTGSEYARIDKYPFAPGYLTGNKKEYKQTMNVVEHGSVTADMYDQNMDVTETYNITGPDQQIVYVPERGVLTLTFAAEEGYHFDVLVKNESDTIAVENNTVVFNRIDADARYKVTFAADVPVPTIDSNGTMTVEGDLTMAQAIDAAGGAAEVNEQITSLIWNSTATLTNSDLDVFTNPNMLVFVADATKYDGDRNNVVVNGTAKNVLLTDVTSGNGNFYCPQMFVAEKISYTHAYNQKTQAGVSRGWESIAMPFEVETITHETNGLIAPFGNEASEKHFWLRAISENGLVRATKIEANNAYLISMPNSEDYPAEYNLNGQVTFSSEYVEVPVTSPKVMELQNGDQGRIRIVPTFQHQMAEQNIYALNVGEARDIYAEGSVFVANLRDIRPFEVYTIHESNGQQPAPMYMPIGSYFNDLTGIEELHFEMPMKGKWFDMNGRQLLHAPSGKGVYIYNGKKYVIK